MRNIYRVVYCLNSDSIPLSYPHERYYGSKRAAEDAVKIFVELHYAIPNNKLAERGIAVCLTSGELLIKIETLRFNSKIYSL
jgi:hypothetical protein